MEPSSRWDEEVPPYRAIFIGDSQISPYFYLNAMRMSLSFFLFISSLGLSVAFVPFRPPRPHLNRMQKKTETEILFQLFTPKKECWFFSLSLFLSLSLYFFFTQINGNNKQKKKRSSSNSAIQGAKQIYFGGDLVDLFTTPVSYVFFFDFPLQKGMKKK